MDSIRPIEERMVSEQVKIVDKTKVVDTAGRLLRRRILLKRSSPQDSVSSGPLKKTAIPPVFSRLIKILLSQLGLLTAFFVAAHMNSPGGWKMGATEEAQTIFSL